MPWSSRNATAAQDGPARDVLRNGCRVEAHRGKRPDVFLQRRPCLVAGHLLHVRIEAGLRQHLAERLAIRSVEGQALARQVLLLVLRHHDEDITLLERDLREIAVAQLLKVWRQLLPRLDVERRVEPSPYMVGQAAILLHLVQLRGIDQHQRILLAIDDAGLQRAVYFVEVDRRRRCAEMAEQRDQVWRHRQSDLEALQVIRASDRLGARGDLPEPVIIALVHAVEADLLGRGTEHIAEIAIHRGPDMRVVGERETHAGQSAHRVAWCQQIDRQIVHLHRSGDDLSDHRGIAAQDAVRIDGDLHPSVALLLDLVRGILLSCHRRMLHRRGRTKLIVEFGGIGRPVQYGRGGNTCRSCQHVPARQLLRLYQRCPPVFDYATTYDLQRAWREVRPEVKRKRAGQSAECSGQRSDDLRHGAPRRRGIGQRIQYDEVMNCTDYSAPTLRDCQRRTACARNIHPHRASRRTRR